MPTPIIYAASDLHGNLPDIPSDADVLILAGDICPDFRPFSRDAWRDGDIVDRTGRKQAKWLDTEFREWLDARPQNCSVYATWGNHDFVGVKPFLVPELPWTLLIDSSATLDYLAGIGEMWKRITIYGTPWVPGLPYWAFYADDTRLREVTGRIPSGLDILVSHGPPHGAGDYIPGGTEKQVNKYGNLHGRRVGSTWLREVTIGPRSPKVLICGHIHEDRGVHKSGWADVYNVAAVDALYDLLPNPWTRLHI